MCGDNLTLPGQKWVGFAFFSAVLLDSVLRYYLPKKPGHDMWLLYKFTKLYGSSITLKWS